MLILLLKLKQKSWNSSTKMVEDVQSFQNKYPF